MAYKSGAHHLSKAQWKKLSELDISNNCLILGENGIMASGANSLTKGNWPALYLLNVGTILLDIRFK